MRKWLLTIQLLAACLAGSASALGDTADNLDAQRAAFRKAYPLAERGNWERADADQDLLAAYVLWPDLKAAWLRARIEAAGHDEIEAFLDRYGVIKPAREIRYRYALHLAETGRLADFHQIYERYYQGLEIARLDCLALQAEIAAGRQDRIVSRAYELWLTGRSQEDECDPVFGNLRSQGLLTEEHYRQRFALAIAERQFSLAGYLARSLPPAFADEVKDWQYAARDPEVFAIRLAERKDSEVDRAQLAYALQKIAYQAPATAARLWAAVRDRFTFDDDDKFATDRHIALWAARLHLAEAADMLAAIPAEGADIETWRWLVRAHLLQKDWAEVVRSIDAMPAIESGKNEWQYWRAIALAQTARDDVAQPILTRLAGERDYYGFLAADTLSVPYALRDERIDGNPGLSARLEQIPELIRARELFLVGLEGRGRSEWDAATSTMTSEEQAQAALLAHRWGWHSRAIATVASAGHFDDLEVRYPLAWQQDFGSSAESAGIRDSLAYGIARSESLFMRDIRSSAGAIGVMQLMPATGRSTAQELQLPWAGRATLTDSSANIRLGTWYLGKMLNRFANNPVLATAAYNAGPHRVENWLPDSGALDARIWIENIPYNETRSYVRRVLADDVIFNWRLTGKSHRLSDVLPDVNPGRLRAAVSASP